MTYAASNKEMSLYTFFDKVRIVKEYGILNEFIDAAKEEEYGLQKIIEAYDKRLMNQSLS
jgi:uncharacterized protein YqgQ